MSLKQDLYFIGVVDQFLSSDEEKSKGKKSLNIGPNTKVLISDVCGGSPADLETFSWRMTELKMFDKTYASIQGPNSFTPIFSNVDDWSRSRLMKHFLRIGKMVPTQIYADYPEGEVPQELKTQVREYSLQMLDKAREFCKSEENNTLNGKQR